MKALLLTAMQSGTGKTMLACALMAAFRKRGLRVAPFKAGPDYIDPMYHTAAAGLPGRNLDLYLQGENAVRQNFHRTDADLALVEGAMGYYDGIGGTTDASAWELAGCLSLPAILALRPQGSGVTLAAQVLGMMRFREESCLNGILLTMCSERTYHYLQPILERECGLPVLGYLPVLEEAKIKSRHLGLRTAQEEKDLAGRIGRIAACLEETANLEKLLELSAEIKPEKPVPALQGDCRIAVARDEAFCFCYEDGLDALRRAGAEIVFFSPLRDERLPEKVNGLYLCGGYPELHAERLSRNTGMKNAVRAAVLAGMPTAAECGGLLYLQETLEDPAGKAFPMCGAIPGRGIRTDRLQRFGYLTLRAEEDSLLFRRGERIPAHEFHYWDSTAGGTALWAEKADGRSWRCAYAGENLYAGFPHLHFGGELPLAERFVEAAQSFAGRQKTRTARAIRSCTESES